MKMQRISLLFALAALYLALLTGCSSSHGQPVSSSEPIAPSQVLDFDTLYAENCAACHGGQGRGGAAIALANPGYLAIADESAVHNVVAKGVGGTSMPPFAQLAGGTLTEQQIDLITTGIFSRRGRKQILDGTTPPSYTAKAAGDPEHGRVVYGNYCATCHGPEGRGTPKGSAITNDSFLALVSDQGLRTIVITGRPELGAPDWRGNLPGHPMTDQEITDVVAWLASRRAQNPGQPYSPVNHAQDSEKQDANEH